LPIGIRAGKLNPMGQVDYGSALSGAHYLVLSTESLRVVIEAVA